VVAGLFSSIATIPLAVMAVNGEPPRIVQMPSFLKVPSYLTYP